MLLAEGVDSEDGVESDVGTIMRLFVSPEPFDHTQRAEAESRELGVGIQADLRQVKL